MKTNDTIAREGAEAVLTKVLNYDLEHTGVQAEELPAITAIILHCLTQAQEGREGILDAWTADYIRTRLTADTAAMGMESGYWVGYRAALDYANGAVQNIVRRHLAARPIPSPGAEDTKRLDWLESNLHHMGTETDSIGLLHRWGFYLRNSKDGWHSARNRIDAAMGTPEVRL